MSQKSFVTYEFELPQDLIFKIKSKKPQFGNDGFGELVYYRTYSRQKENGEMENWADTVLRVSKGLFSIFKTHMIEHRLPWDEALWKEYSKEFTEYIFDMKFLPSGRNLWACGTEHVKKYGAMALNNCGFVDTTDLIASATWTMSALMQGTGVGFNTSFKGEVSIPGKEGKKKYIVPDTREGWAESVKVLLEAYVTKAKMFVEPYNDNHDIEFDYSLVRPAGIPIKGFGGISSGPRPLITLHKRIKTYLYCMVMSGYTHLIDTNPYMNKAKEELRLVGEEYLDYMLKAHTKYSHTRLISDIFNAIGSCVVSGGVRRSSLISLGRSDDVTFTKLKDPVANPERGDIMWTSNNTVQFTTIEEFKKHIPRIAKQILSNGMGEPGVCNMLNIKRFGRVNKYYEKSEEYTREREEDKAIGLNPCGEICLESYELCNLSEVFPPRCIRPDDTFDEESFYKAIEYATFYSSIIALLPTTSPETNKVIAANRRLGVSLSGTALISEKYGYSYTIDLLKKGYRKVREINSKIADMAGVPRSIRVTTIKPSGSISQLVGVTPGIHHSIENRFIIRRMRISENSDLVPYLIKAGIPHEKDRYADATLCFEFPVDQGEGRTEAQVSMWEQLEVSKMYQKFWSDNSISVTIKYDEKEAQCLEEAIALNIGDVKTLSFLPKATGAYPQAPYEAITEEKYLELKGKILPIDFEGYCKSKVAKDTEAPKFCQNDICTV